MTAAGTAGAPKVRVEESTGYAVLTLDDPARRNALSVEMAAEVVDAVDRLEASGTVRALVVTGAPPAFCAGADLAQLAAADEGGLRAIYSAFVRIAESPLLTVAAVNGPAVGAGMNMALACDVRLVAARGSFDTRFLALGLHPGGGHSWMLQQAVPYATAAALVLGAEAVRGPDAARLGLAYRCVDDGDVLDAARQFVAAAASAPAGLVERAKESLKLAGHGDLQGTLDHELAAQLWSVAQPSFAERIAALRARLRART